MKQPPAVELYISVRFVWYDVWIGLYIDTDNQSIYICPLPCVCLKVQLVH